MMIKETQKELTLTRLGRTYKIDLDKIITSRNNWICRKCAHTWKMSNREKQAIPTTCPKCFDKMWFMTPHHKNKSRSNKTSFERGRELEKPKTILKGGQNEKW